MMKKFALMIAMLLLCLSSIAHPATKYSIVDLGDLGGGTSQAFGINNAGQVVGRSLTSLGETRAFVWDRQTGMQDLGVLGGYGGEAYGINDKGQVVGRAFTDGNTVPHQGWITAFQWSTANGMTDLGALYPNGGSWAFSVNASGLVAGISDLDDHRIRAAVWDGFGTIQDIGTLGGDDSEGFAINDAGQVVGRADLANGSSKAFVWDAESGMRPTGPEGSTAYDINNIGCVVGAFGLAGEIHAFRWTEGGEIEDLGGPNGQFGVWGEATDINDSGLVVGWSKFSDVYFRALLWDGDGQMSDLNDLLDESGTGWTLASAEAINNLGQITGTGLYDGQTRAFILNPIPEPSSLLALGAGILGLVGIIRKKYG